MDHLNELAFYGLAGAPNSPADLLPECRDGEALGLGSVFLSERFNVKEAVTLSGAAAASTTHMGITTGVTNHNTRHPVVTASYATTMHRITGGRFALGLGRGMDRMFDAFGLPRITTAAMDDFAGLMRRLWRGEVVMGHDGPAGTWPVLALDPDFREDIPLLMSAFGPQSLRLAGRSFDAVLLHTFFTDDTMRRCVDTVRSAAEQAGRDPSSVRIWSCFAVIGDWVPADVKLKKTVGRMATYLQAYGDLMVRTNNWDPAVLERFRADSFVAGFRGALDQKATTSELEHVATLIPDEWLAPAGYGTPEQCAQAVLHQMDLGADSVILHGVSPTELAPVVEAYRRLRPVGRFDHLPANPGWVRTP
ncbi:MAG TPA: TIGR03857 family LLM class F420-dependent oxidoreductase [Acidimicrobiaceae bacterium]|nr:TIGR03857 family LLM class F420-dependent oxidoreductase [Acidimicrobiaceae bacterium]